MNQTPNVKVSVLIPVHNMLPYLRQCLDSVISQSLREIEIICIDSSDDGSTDLLRDYEARYANLRCIHYEEPFFLVRSRKYAVQQASGEYIMFLGADDYLEENACERAYEAIRENGADILQFGSIVENGGRLPSNRIAVFSKNVNKRPGKSISGDLLRACFVEKKFGWTLWNKIYKGDLCREAFQALEEDRFTCAEELYTTFCFLERATEYTSISDSLHHCCYGRDVTGKKSLSLDDYRFVCEGTKVFRALERHVNGGRVQGGLDYQDVMQAVKLYLLSDQGSKLLTQMAEEDKAAALSVFREAWDCSLPELLGNLYLAFNKRRAEFVALVNRHAGELGLKQHPRKIKTVALYFRSLVNGGAQRVIAVLANRLAEYEQGGGHPYRVIVVTDEEPQKDDYPLSPRVIRYELPSYQECEEDFTPRMEALTRLFETYSVDIFINSMWDYLCSFWDMLCTKLNPSHPAYFFHAHNCFVCLWSKPENSVMEMFDDYALSDGIITLSEADRTYWSAVNPCVCHIPNPCFISETKKNERSAGSGTILLLARMAWQKRPLEILRIMEYVVQEIPDVRCRIVGGGNANLLTKLGTRIQETGLGNNVMLEGFHTDVEPYYAESDVFVLTSEFEGFALTLFESAAHGIPTVTYELPYLSYYDEIDGWDCVPQMDAAAAARRIITILQDREEWEKRSATLYETFQRFNAHDILKAWISFFNQWETGVFPPKKDVSGNMFQMMFLEAGKFHTSGMKKLLDEKSKLTKETATLAKANAKLETRLQKEQEKLQAEKEKLQAVKEKLQAVKEKLQAVKEKHAQGIERLRAERGKNEALRSSVSFRIGRVLTWPLRIIRDIVRQFKR